MQIQPAPLVLNTDATTLFTSSGMQPLVPYLSGREVHHEGKRLVDIQPSIRTQDIEEVGDTSHTTFFEMMGNWSLGDYFKEDELSWKWDFLTRVVGLDPDRLYVTVFEGNSEVPRDEESVRIWKKLGVKEDHIFYYGLRSNWWSRSGEPSAMPAGEIGGPDSEIYFNFGTGARKGPESEDDEYLEIGNSVFIQYQKCEDGSLKELPSRNVDFGGGLERILAASHSHKDVYMTDLFQPIIRRIESLTGTSYEEHTSDMRIITDHIRAATFLLRDGVVPSNKEHGYVLRRLLRRAGMRMHALCSGVHGLEKLHTCVESVFDVYKGIYFDDHMTQQISVSVSDEMKRFSQTLEKGLREIDKHEHLNGKIAFDLFQSYGFPVELTAEIAQQRGTGIDIQEFYVEREKHKKLSQESSSGKFKGGLADTSDQVIRFHTATHLLHQALHDILGDSIRQEGSNITQERLRFDVHADRMPTAEEIIRIERIVNDTITSALPVYKHIMKKTDADKLHAYSFFKDVYGDEVSVYAIGGQQDDPQTAYSLEFCGGPHVQSTNEIGPVRIQKVQKIGAQTIRLYLVHASENHSS